MITRTDAFLKYAQLRAYDAHVAAEAADHPADKAALRAAARAWERISGPGVAWSTLPLRRDLAELKRAVAQATGPCQPPQPPKSAPPARESVTRVSTPAVDPVTIQF